MRVKPKKTNNNKKGAHLANPVAQEIAINKSVINNPIKNLFYTKYIGSAFRWVSVWLVPLIKVKVQ